MEIQTVSSFDYIRFGSGPRTFVILPGVGMVSVMESADAIAQGFAEFAKHYTVYVFSLEKDIDDSYSVPSTAGKLARVMKTLGIANADIFGASQGGMVALTLAIEEPELVHALYLGGTLARQNATSTEVSRTWMELCEAGDVQGLNHYLNTRVYSPEYYNTYAEIFAGMEQRGTQADLNRFRLLARSVGAFDCYDRLTEIRCPVFAEGSEGDRVLNVLATWEIAQKLGCQCHIYPGYGHAFYDEAPDFRPRMLHNLLQTWSTEENGESAS